jgi:CDP-4-dehydro-6-deoxyglucose reductase
MPRITFLPSGQNYDIKEGTTILVAAIQNGLPLRHDCTEAICGTDRVTVVAGKENLTAKTQNEELTLEMMNAGEEERLGCVARILGDVTVYIPA